MIYIAFTLGLFGSLHCLGMCGPLAFSLLPGIQEKSSKNVVRAVSYNAGRVISYVTMGMLVGLFGGLFNLSGLQKPLGISLGIVLVIMFLFSFDIEKLLFRSSSYSKLYSKYSTYLSKVIGKLKRQPPLLLGMLNGLIPCGLVYLALAGALTSGGVLSGGQFMMWFGLGTFPAMFLLLVSFSLLDLKRRLNFRKVFAFLQLFVGVFLIYRAVHIEIPADLSLIDAMLNPVMCH